MRDGTDQHGAVARRPIRETAPPVAARETWVDWLRVCAMAGVFLVHVGQVFNPWDEWHVTNVARSRVAGEVVLLLAPWVMPLFMLLAGCSAWHSLARRTNAQYLRERLTRVLLPLALGILVLVPPQVWAERRWRGEFDGSLIAFYPHAFEGLYPRGNLAWHHLWFLGHLFVYAVVTLPLFRHWRGEAGRRQMRRIGRFCGRPNGLLWLALPLLVERHLVWLLQGVGSRDWSGQSMLLVAYVYGYVLAGEPLLRRDVDAQWPRALAHAVATTIALMALAWLGIVPTRLPPDSPLGAFAFWTLYAVGAWAWVVAVVGIGRRFLRAQSSFLSLARRDGFAWYLLHQTIIVLAAARIVTWDAGIPAKSTALAAVALVGTVGGAALLARARQTLGSPWTLRASRRRATPQGS